MEPLEPESEEDSVEEPEPERNNWCMRLCGWGCGRGPPESTGWYPRIQMSIVVFVLGRQFKVVWPLWGMS